MKKLTVCLCAAILFLLSACGQPDDRLAEGSFEFTSENLPAICTTPYFSEFGAAVAFCALGENGAVQSASTDEAYRLLAEGECDIVIAHGYAEERENASFDMTEIAADALVFLCSASNPAESLTTGQITEIYSGAADWSAYGGNEIPIVAFTRENGTAAQNAFSKYFGDIAAPAVLRRVATADGAFDAEVRFDNRPGAIGYTLLSAVGDCLGQSVKPLGIDGKAPSDADYPYVIPVYAAIRSSEPEDSPVRILYNWLLSEQGTALAERYFN